jgi:Ni,Fe-hydrogenase I small subunit
MKHAYIGVYIWGYITGYTPRAFGVCRMARRNRHTSCLVLMATDCVSCSERCSCTDAVPTMQQIRAERQHEVGTSVTSGLQELHKEVYYMQGVVDCAVAVNVGAYLAPVVGGSPALPNQQVF